MILKQEPGTGWWTVGTTIYGEEVYIHQMHSPKLCEGRGCAMHNHPSMHPLFDAPMRWTGILDRKCKHGFWHADKDEIAYYESIGSARFCDDGCDGCCDNWNTNE